MFGHDLVHAWGFGHHALHCFHCGVKLICGRCIDSDGTVHPSQAPAVTRCRIPLERIHQRRPAQGSAWVVIICGAIVALAGAWVIFECGW